MSKTATKNVKADLKIQRERDLQLVKGIFQNKETRGGTVSFPFRKYKEDDVVNYTFTDGQHYTIPLMVANHLNQNCFQEVHSHCVGPDGKPATKVGQVEYRFGFINTDFRPIEGFEEQGSGLEMATISR